MIKRLKYRSPPTAILLPSPPLLSDLDMVNSGRIIAALLTALASVNALAPTALPAKDIAETASASESRSHYHRHVRQLLPVAYWSFQAGQSDLGHVEGEIVFDREGPTREFSKSFGSENSAAEFVQAAGKPGVIVVEDVGPGSQFDFDNGDPITIEAWVNPQKDLQNGSTMSVLRPMPI